ncbi:conserved hypothetical protein [Vibrio phage 424E50-1]|nr:conserved hypothetical protein [Vibrio phage 424E50-1]
MIGISDIVHILQKGLKYFLYFLRPFDKMFTSIKQYKLINLNRCNIMTNTYDIEINKEMVLSTCHVKEETLNTFVIVNNVGHSSDAYATRFLVSHALSYFKFEGVDLPKELLNLLQIAKAHNCKWLVLDCDGTMVEGLPTFDW